jgi:hypothetical protein
MITEKEIIEILNEWEFGANLKNGEFVRGVKNEYYKNVARALVSKNESLHDVGHSDNRYCEDCGDYVKDGCDNKDCKDFKSCG